MLWLSVQIAFYPLAKRRVGSRRFTNLNTSHLWVTPLQKISHVVTSSRGSYRELRCNAVEFLLFTWFGILSLIDRPRRLCRSSSILRRVFPLIKHLNEQLLILRQQLSQNIGSELPQDDLIFLDRRLKQRYLCDSHLSIMHLVIKFSYLLILQIERLKQALIRLCGWQVVQEIWYFTEHYLEVALSFRFIASFLENLNPLELFLDGLNGKLVPLLYVILWEDVGVF